MQIKITEIVVHQKVFVYFPLRNYNIFHIEKVSQPSILILKEKQSFGILNF